MGTLTLFTPISDTTMGVDGCGQRATYGYVPTAISDVTIQYDWRLDGARHEF